MAATEYAPTKTASAQPVVITIQPAPCAFDRASSTPATTPLPSRMRSAVPTISATNGDMALSSGLGDRVLPSFERLLPLARGQARMKNRGARMRGVGRGARAAHADGLSRQPRGPERRQLDHLRAHDVGAQEVGLDLH